MQISYLWKRRQLSTELMFGGGGGVSVQMCLVVNVEVSERCQRPLRRISSNVVNGITLTC